MGGKKPIIVVSMLLALGCLSFPVALGQSPAEKIDCKISDCAQRMVEIANKLMAENEDLIKRLGASDAIRLQLTDKVKQLETDQTTTAGALQELVKSLANWNGGILAAGVVRGGQAIYSSRGTSFDPGTGRVSFPNPKGLKFIPIIAAISPNAQFVTESCYVRSIGPDFFILWQGAQDTSGRNEPPRDCTFTVVGAEG
jgi:hypothetical protein